METVNVTLEVEHVLYTRNYFSSSEINALTGKKVNYPVYNTGMVKEVIDFSKKIRMINDFRINTLLVITVAGIHRCNNNDNTAFNLLGK